MVFQRQCLQRQIALHEQREMATTPSNTIPIPRSPCQPSARHLGSTQRNGGQTDCLLAPHRAFASSSYASTSSLAGVETGNEDLSCKIETDSLSSREVLVVGLNPAFQTTLLFNHFRPYHVNRATRKSHSIGGKGQNFVISVEQLGRVDRVSVLQYLGGMTGNYIHTVLAEKGVHQINVKLNKPSRTCTTVLCRNTGTMTELIEPASRIDAEARHRMECLVVDVMKESPALEIIALCGTLPPGINGTMYSFIAEKKRPDVLLFLDACQDLDVLNTGKVDILKINAEEAFGIAANGGIPTPSSSNESLPDSNQNSDEPPLLAVGRKLLKAYSLKLLALTDGSDPAYLFDTVTNTVHKFILPDLMQMIDTDDDCFASLGSSSLSSSLPGPTTLGDIGDSGFVTNGTTQKTHGKNRSNDVMLNPLGAGDTCAGVFCIEYLESKNPVNAFRTGLAAASASCLQVDSTAHFDLLVMDKLYDRIVVEQVGTIHH